MKMAVFFDAVWAGLGYSQIFRSYLFGPSGFWTMAPVNDRDHRFLTALRCVWSHLRDIVSIIMSVMIILIIISGRSASS